MEAAQKIVFKWEENIASIKACEWNNLALKSETPLFEYEWLGALENSGCVGLARDWKPWILTARRNRELIAAALFYEKNNSEGEFIPSYLWNEVAQNLGLGYYPKLLGMVPFSPISAYQFLEAEESDEELTRGLFNEIFKLYEDKNWQGLHFSFTTSSWKEKTAKLGFFVWEHPCFYWLNEGYRDWEDFLDIFTKGQRHNIRREEEKLFKSGIKVEFLAGSEIPEAWADLMYQYYYNTNQKYWPYNSLYLNKEFFQEIFAVFKHRLALGAAFLSGQAEPFALSLFLQKGPRLWGRYWGCRSYIPFLHFSLCYYEPIRFAIANKISFFDPGIGTEHKARRGFRSGLAYSLHLFKSRELNFLFATNLKNLNKQTRKVVDELNKSMPLRENRAFQYS